MTSESSHYEEAYGCWAGQPSGQRPDYTLCCRSVQEPGRSISFHQCRHKRGFGPDKAYCKQHDPHEVAKRDRARAVKYAEERNKDRVKWWGARFEKALREIAAGHNDAKARAKETLDLFDADKW